MTFSRLQRTPAMDIREAHRIWEEALWRYDGRYDIEEPYSYHAINILSSVTEASREELTIPVSKQRCYMGADVITSALANTLCVDLGANGVLERLNTILGTSYASGSVISILNSYIRRNYDFGTVYAYLRRHWHNIPMLERSLRANEEKDREMRRKVLVDGRITKRKVPPRLVWDLYANRVVPYWVAGQTPCAISHAWVNGKDRVNVMSPINGYEWPVPMPKDANLDLIRIEMLNSQHEGGFVGIGYTWLDVLCLRQEGGKNEHLRLEEWKLDVPTIGAVYHTPGVDVVCYFNGLGRPLHLTLDDFDSDRCWFRRAWTLQEVTLRPIIGGKTGNSIMAAEVRRRLNGQLTSLRRVRQGYDIFNALLEMQNRVSTKPLDRVAGLVYLLKLDFIPIYDAEKSEEDAWEILVDAMKPENRTELLFSYPEPGNGKKCWRPSWQQAMDNNVVAGHYSFQKLQTVSRTDNADADWYTSYCIESGDVRGLDEVPKEEKHREGQLVLKDMTGAPHEIRIVADHKFPIPNGSYTLIGSTLAQSYYWVVGRLQEDGKFEKLSVFKMFPDRYLDMEKCGVKDNVRTDLC